MIKIDAQQIFDEIKRCVPDDQMGSVLTSLTLKLLRDISANMRPCDKLEMASLFKATIDMYFIDYTSNPKKVVIYYSLN